MDLQLIETCKIKSEDHSQRIAMNEEKMSELVGSIQNDGLLQPITVKCDGDGYTVVFGHRRLEACKRSGWTHIPAFIAQGDEAKLHGLTFSENFFRDDLTAVELAAAIAEEYQSGRMTIERLAQGFRRSTDWVQKQIAICGWPQDVLEGMHTGNLSVAAAANLACITEDFYRKSLVGQAVDNGATARTTSAWLQAWRSMLPLAEATKVEPEPGSPSIQPMVPQAPCLACHDVFRCDQLSHVPLCAACIKLISTAGQGVMS